MKDFYAILNVPRTASADEIQAAYRDLAKVLHPDVNNRGAGLMRDVNEAYATLRDPAKRKRYDIESKVRQFVPPVSAQRANRSSRAARWTWSSSQGLSSRRISGRMSCPRYRAS